MINRLIILLSFAIVTACGGGGESGEVTTPTDPNQLFDLSKLQSTTIGTIYSSRLTGSDSNGVSYAGSVSVANRAQILLGGVMVTPQDLLINLSGGGSSFTVTGTSYIDTSGNLISLEIQTTGLTCTPVTPDKLPDSVKIGDFGILSTMNCSDNTTQERNWRVEDAGNGKIRIILNSTTKDLFNDIVSVTDVTYTIDGSGNIVAFKTVTIIYSSGYTLTYQSA